MKHPGVLSEILAQKGTLPFVRLVVASTEGSAPRGPGAAMLVMQDATSGTIGGGQLEFEAIAHARRMLATIESEPTAWLRSLRTWPLGPSLGQCCGGTVQVLFERYGSNELDVISTIASGTEVNDAANKMLVHPTRSGETVFTCPTLADLTPRIHNDSAFTLEHRSLIHSAKPTLLSATDTTGAFFVEPITHFNVPLFIYGAGHVGRAIVQVASILDFDIYWVDTHNERFPKEQFLDVQRVVARDPSIVAQASPEDAFHVVLTYSHALDLAICHALLAKPTAGFVGLIGSQTKRNKFRKRLLEAGLSRPALDRLTCPIGIGGLQGKEPATIAVSIVAQLIERLEHVRDAGVLTAEEQHGSSQRISA